MRRTGQIESSVFGAKRAQGRGGVGRPATRPFRLLGILSGLSLLYGATAGVAAAHDLARQSSAPSAADVTALPLGDQKWSTTTYQRGYIYLCEGAAPTSSTSTISAPWIDTANNTFDLTVKAGYAVDGEVSWASQAQFSAPILSGTARPFTTNDLPSAHTTGVFPIATTDNASQYDGNPNSISAQSISASLTASPVLRDTPQCVGGGTVAVTTTGVVLFNALDSKGRDALANEIGDSCDGHPNAGGMYHYHTLSSCISDSLDGHSNLVGYATDGFGLYGYRGEAGTELTNDDLDECHGHTHSITWDGVTTSMYHYHATREFPYTIGCFRGTAAVVSSGTTSTTATSTPTSAATATAAPTAPSTPTPTGAGAPQATPTRPAPRPGS
jgi:hypothetical protein